MCAILVIVELLTLINNCSDIILPSFPVKSIDRESRIFDAVFVRLEYRRVYGDCSEKTLWVHCGFLYLNLRVFKRIMVLLGNTGRSDIVRI